MQSLLIEAAGWIGAALILGSYILVSMGKLSGRSRTFQWMNVVGAAGFVLNSGWHGAIPSTALNALWLLVGLATLWSLRRPRKAA
jgi:MYXO-CTERM domain-containing protein